MKRVNTPSVKLAFLTIGFLFVMMILPQLLPLAQNETNFQEALLAPSATHWFGTDEYGRDIFARVWTAGTLSIGASLAIVGISYVVGGVLGAVAGFFGGAIDTVISRVLDVFLAFPSLLIAITIAGILGGDLHNGMIALVIAYAPYYAKLARTQILQLKQSDFMTVAYMNGAPASYRLGLLWSSIQQPLIVYASVNIGSVILSLATLSFLGIGVKVPQAEWGAMLNEGRQIFEQAPGLMFFPGLALTITVLFFNAIGHRIQQLLEEKS